MPVNQLGLFQPAARSPYRYRLSREWGPGGRRLLFVMLNPSTADEVVPDPTITRCIGFAQREGFDGLRVVNLFAWRSTKPGGLQRAVEPVGEHNAAAIRDEAAACCKVLVAWGRWGERWPGRVAAVVEQLREAGVRELWCLGTTKSGQPRHPLYLRRDTPLVPWRRDSSALRG